MSHDEPWWAMPSFKIQGAAWRSTGPEPRPSSRRSCLGGTVWRVPGMTRFLQLRAAARSASGDLRRSTSIKSFPLWFCSNLFLKTNHAFEAAMLFTSSKSKHPQFFWKPPSAAKLLATLWPWANWRKTSTITKAKDQSFIQISSLRSGSFRFRCLCVCVSLCLYVRKPTARTHSGILWLAMCVCVCVLIPVYQNNMRSNLHACLCTDSRRWLIGSTPLKCSSWNTWKMLQA